MQTMAHVDDVSRHVVDAAVGIHRKLGPGLFESVYEAVLANELERRGLAVERQKPIDFEYDGVTYAKAFVVDLVVTGLVVVEVKSIEKLAAVHRKQLLTYLRLMNLQVGLLMNFGGTTLKEGLQRIVNNYVPSHMMSP